LSWLKISVCEQVDTVSYHIVYDIIISYHIISYHMIWYHIMISIQYHILLQYKYMIHSYIILSSCMHAWLPFGWSKRPLCNHPYVQSQPNLFFWGFLSQKKLKTALFKPHKQNKTTSKWPQDLRQHFFLLMFLLARSFRFHELIFSLSQNAQIGREGPRREIFDAQFSRTSIFMVLTVGEFSIVFEKFLRGQNKASPYMPAFK
jgi:hypothetical protein